MTTISTLMSNQIFQIAVGALVGYLLSHYSVALKTVNTILGWAGYQIGPVVPPKV